MCLTDKIFLQTHVTFCEYLVFHEFKRRERDRDRDRERPTDRQTERGRPLEWLVQRERGTDRCIHRHTMYTAMATAPVIVRL